MPHGFNFWTPVTNAGSLSWLYDYARANNADNLPTIQAFSASHEPSPWMGDRQTFQVMPSAASGTPDTGRTARALAFRHENETARPYYYGVTLRERSQGRDDADRPRGRPCASPTPATTRACVFDNVTDQAG